MGSPKLQVFGKIVPSNKIDPVFANNSWETIVNVSRFDDPSKYWKEGDYKMLDFPISNNAKLGEIEVVGGIATNNDFTFEISDMSAFVSHLGSEDKCYVAVHFDYGLYTTTIELTLQRVFNSPAFYREVKGGILDITDFECGLTVRKINPDFTYDNVLTLEAEVAVTFGTSSFPMMILDFHHDPVVDPYTYGKQKAGTTLMLGASRNVYGDGTPSLYTKSIAGLMDDRGYFKSPNRVLKDYSDGATNWAESGFRLALQTLFDKTEIGNYIVSVQKYTSRYYKKNIYWSDALITNDKVFLPSEYEIFGQQILAPYIEGEQYKFYKDGYSKFMWSDALLMGDSDLGRLWLRSAYGAKVNELQGDSNYSLNVYLGVNSRNPANVLYSPSYATSGDGVIAPCVNL